MTPSRQPRFTRFLVTGGLAGLVVGVVASLLSAPAAGYDDYAGLGYLALVGVFVGVILGAGVAALLAGRQPRQPRQSRPARGRERRSGT